MSCIFCDILNGSAPAAFVYQDSLCAAFMDINPINPGHVLVVPSDHCTWLAELDPTSAGHIFQVAQRVDTALRQGSVKCEGVNLFLADGQAAGQDVMHVHLHVIPRYKGDGHHMRFSPKYYLATPAGELEKIAALISERMRGEE